MAPLAADSFADAVPKAVTPGKDREAATALAGALAGMIAARRHAAQRLGKAKLMRRFA